MTITALSLNNINKKTMGLLEDFYIENNKAVLVSFHLKTNKSSPRETTFIAQLVQSLFNSNSIAKP
jgi:hypothetical protein